MTNLIVKIKMEQQGYSQMTTNGTSPLGDWQLLRCQAPNCVVAPDCLVDDIPNDKRYCEHHYRELIVFPLVKRMTFHKLESDRLAGEVAKANHAIKQAKVDAGVVDALPFMHCKNCNFKSQYWNTIEQHEALCGKKKKDAGPKPPRVAGGPPRVARSPKAPSGLTEDDLT
jgi:hypothetical protein